MGVIRRLVSYAVAVLTLTIVAVWIAETVAARRLSPDLLERVDALIVLGGGADPDGTLDWVGRRRAAAAVMLLERRAAEAAILTGTLNDPERPGGEGRLLREAIAAAGISRERLFVEPNARTTLENLRLSFAIAEERGFERLAVVTDAYHLPRALALAALLGRSDVAGAASDGVREHSFFKRLGYLAREACAWWYNAAKAAVWIGLGLLGWSEAERAGWVV
ncbi:MAG: YdcF family protein [Paracoccaceae bacterium]